ncbi:TPA: hypothetical protein MBI04_003565 [Klebsiella pneumoniae]|nr:hypothetical protein [Klebsiella pneumoniae]
MDFSDIAHKVDYIPETGALMWNENAYSTVKGKRADSPTTKDGYSRFGGENYNAHRFIWWLHYGDIPEGMEIDHINGKRDDNRIENLRLATRAENNINVRGRGTRSGARNVRLTATGRYQVQIGYMGKNHTFGTYDTVEEASAIAEQKRRELHGEFTHA